MERNEEIKQALSRYVKNRGVSGNRIVDVERDAAFIAGAMFADNNPDTSSLWHSASEEPICGKRLLLLHTNSVVSIFNYTGKNDWSMLASCGICQYAYISDLLPKGGEK